jgi:flagellar basal-body rod modification protein FlgD
MPIQAVNGSNAAAAAGTTTAADAAKKSSPLSQDTFLKLMLAQLKNQDPMKPTDPSEFLGQLAQFSQVSGIQSMQGSMQALSDSLRSSQVLDGTTLVGHEILAAADEATLGAAGSIAGAVDVPDNATAAQIVVTDTAGQVIRRVPVSAQAGTMAFTWDGMTGTGERAAPGNYRIDAYAQVGGATEQLQTQLVSRVSSVTIDQKNFQLTLNTSLGPIALADVRRVM